MTGLDDLIQEQCDFCEATWREDLDEPLEPLHIGDPPQPQQVTARGIQNENQASWSFSGQGKLDAIINAMREMDGLEFEVHERVREVKAVGGKTHFAKTTSDGEMYFDSEVKEKTAAELQFSPEAREVEPDAMVCQECAEMFRNLGQE